MPNKEIYKTLGKIINTKQNDINNRQINLKNRKIELLIIRVFPILEVLGITLADFLSYIIFVKLFNYKLKDYLPKIISFTLSSSFISLNLYALLLSITSTPKEIKESIHTDYQKINDDKEDVRVLNEERDLLKSQNIMPITNVIDTIYKPKVRKRSIPL